MSRHRNLLSIALGVGIVGGGATFARLTQSAWAPPSDRIVAWNPGVPGGIPHRTEVCATIPAGASVASIRAALDSAACNDKVVQLSAGQYTVNGDSIWIPSNRTLRGAGPGLTRLVSPNNASLQVSPVAIGHLWPTYGAERRLTNNAPKGSTSVTVDNSAGLAVGEIVLIDQLADTNVAYWGPCQNGDDCRQWFTRVNRPLGDLVQVVAIPDSTTVTFDPPLSLDYRTTLTAQLTKLADNNGNAVQLVSRAGVEDLTIQNPNSQNEKGGILFAWAKESWARNIEVLNSKGDNVSFQGTFRCTVRDSKFQIPQSTSVVNGGAWYGLSFSHYASHNLFENNIVDGHNKVMVMRAAGPGNVISYSVFDNGRISGNSWVETGLNPGHMATPHHALFEGNWAFNADPDPTWGNGAYNTFFRNHLTGKRTALAYGGHSRAAGPMWGHWYYTFAGNVLGLPSQPTSVYEQDSPNDPPSGWEGISMWRIGFTPEQMPAIPGGAPANGGWGQADPKVVQTLIREGNFDYVRNQVDGTGASLPPSLYLTGKPGWWPANSPWPWVEPQGSTKTACLPARARFEGTTCGAAPPSPTPSPSASPTSVPTAAPTATSTPVPLPTATRTPTPVPSPTGTPVPPTPTPVPSPTPGPTGLFSTCTQTSPRTTTTTATNAECSARQLAPGCLKLLTDRGTSTCYVGVR